MSLDNGTASFFSTWPLWCSCLRQRYCRMQGSLTVVACTYIPTRLHTYALQFPPEIIRGSVAGMVRVSPGTPGMKHISCEQIIDGDPNYQVLARRNTPPLGGGCTHTHYTAGSIVATDSGRSGPSIFGHAERACTGMSTWHILVLSRLGFGSP